MIMNPLNPFSPLNPLAISQMNAFGPQNFVAQQKPRQASVFGTLSKETGMSLAGECTRNKRKAILLANKIIAIQNSKIFEGMINLVLKSNFLANLAQMKLNSATRTMVGKVLSSSLDFSEKEIEEAEFTTLESDEFEEELNNFGDKDYSNRIKDSTTEEQILNQMGNIEKT